jgi:hypothetical protein
MLQRNWRGIYRQFQVLKKKRKWEGAENGTRENHNKRILN